MGPSGYSRPGNSRRVVWDPGNLRVLAFDTLGTLTSAEALDGAGTVRARSDLRNLSYVDPFRARAVGNHGVLEVPQGHQVLAWWGEEPGP